jgi:hypothetical protein
MRQTDHHRWHRSHKLLVLIALILWLLTAGVSCSGGGGGGGNAPVPVLPIIIAGLYSFPTASVPPGFAPPGFNSAASVEIWNDANGVIIPNATVSMNGVVLQYNPTDAMYEGYVNVSPGDAVTLTATVNGKSYTASGTQFTDYPAITSPAPGASWSVGNSHTITWSGGGPVVSSSDSYVLAIADAVDPNINLIWPSDGYFRDLDSTVTSNIIPANGISLGDRLAVAGITREIFLSDYSTYLIDLFITGVTSVPLTVVPDQTPTNVTAAPGNGQVSLSWDPVIGSLSYNIYWATTAANANKISGTQIACSSSPCLHIGATNSTPYYYVVTAVTGSGESAESAPLAQAVPGTSLMGGAVQGYPLTLTNTLAPLAGMEYDYGYADSAGTAARFYGPQGITTDGANLYVADTYNHTIRKIVIANGEVTTLAGKAGFNGSDDGIGPAARFDYPYGITTDGANLYVADTYNHTIRKIVISTGVVTTLAGSAGLAGSSDGTRPAARFYNPRGITTDGANLYVGDMWNNTVRKIVISTGEATTLAGSAGQTGSNDGMGAAARFVWPTGVTTDGTSLYVTDVDPDYGWHTTIRKIAITDGSTTTLPSLNFYIAPAITTDGISFYFVNFEGLARIR